MKKLNANTMNVSKAEVAPMSVDELNAMWGSEVPSFQDATAYNAVAPELALCS